MATLVSTLPPSVSPSSPPAAPAAKRARVQAEAGTDEYDFIVTISNPHSFKALCEIIGNVLINTHFQMVHSDHFEGVRVDTIDPNAVCMVKARFACNVWLSPRCAAEEGGVRVCLRMKTLSTLFRHISANHMLNLQRRRGSSDLILRVFNRFDQSSSMEFVLKTLEQAPVDASITNIDSQYTVEMMLAQCKTMFKMGKDIKAAHMRFEIFENENSETQTKQTYFCISGVGEEATARYTFQSATKEETTEDGQTVYALQQQSASPSVAAMKRVYYENFSTEFLNLFLKSMEKQTVQITLASNGPLILHYQLGADQSVVRFILAPQERVEEEDGC